MVKLLNPYTGSVTMVHESRVDKYLASGYIGAACEAVVENAEKGDTETPKKPAPKRRKKKEE